MRSSFSLSLTLFRIRSPRPSPTVGNRFAFAVGSFLDRVCAFLNRTVLRKHPIRTVFVPTLAAVVEDAGENTRHLARTVSFSLLTFAAGFLAVLYLILR